MITQFNNYTNNLADCKRTERFLLTMMMVLAFLGLLLANTAYAQDRSINLDEALKLGIQNSKQLKLSQSKIDQAVSEYEQAKDRVLPSGSSSFGYNRAEIPAHTLDLGGSAIHLPSSADAYLGTVSASETIYGGNKLKYAQQSTNLLVQIARLDVDKDKDQVAYDIISSYYNLYKVLQSKKVVAQNLEVIDGQVKQAQRFFDQGLVTKNDVLRFQLQRSNVELNGIDLESNRKIINYNLDVLLGLPETTQLTIAEISEAEHPLQGLTTYIDSAFASRKELKQLDLRTQVAETNIKTVEANKLPTLAASASAYYVDVSGNPIPQSGKFITPIALGLTVSWNFSSLWNNQHKVAEAKIQRYQTTVNKDITTDAIKNEVNRSYQEYATALNRISLLQASIAQAGENNKILESKYRSNIASATDRADAEQLLYQAQINLELAKADAGLAYYNLLKSTGKLNK